MNGEIKLPEGLVEKAKQKLETDSAADKAALTALPGSLREIWKKPESIKVKLPSKEYQVRPFYDADFEYLQSFEHPICEFLIGGTKFGEEIKDLRGKHAWIIYWMLTRSIKESCETCDKGKEEILKLAREEFGQMQIGELMLIAKPVFEQVGVYISSMVLLSPADEESKKND